MSHDYATDESHPNIPVGGKRERYRVYIEDTKGLRVRKNRSEDLLEIWVSGELIASWAGADSIEPRLETIMRASYAAGYGDGVKETRKAIREVLGLEGGS